MAYKAITSMPKIGKTESAIIAHVRTNADFFKDNLLPMEMRAVGQRSYHLELTDIKLTL